MKYITLLLIILSSTACGNKEVIYETPFKKYELQVAEQLNLPSHLLHIPVVFETDEHMKHMAGYCKIHPTQAIGLKIAVKESLWNRLSETGRLALIAHEMLHCYAMMDHHEHDNEGSLMHPRLDQSIKCLKTQGLQDCIQFSFALQDLGVIDTFRDL